MNKIYFVCFSLFILLNQDILAQNNCATTGNGSSNSNNNSNLWWNGTGSNCSNDSITLSGNSSLLFCPFDNYDLWNLLFGQINGSCENLGQEENGSAGNCNTGNASSDSNSCAGNSSSNDEDGDASTNGNCSSNSTDNDSNDSQEDSNTNGGSCNNDNDVDLGDDDNDSDSSNGSCSTGGGEDDDEESNDEEENNDSDSVSGNCGNGGNEDDEEDNDDDQDSDDDDDSDSGNGSCGNGGSDDDEEDNDDDQDSDDDDSNGDHDDDEDSDDDNDSDSGNGSCGNGGNEDDEEDNDDDQDGDDDDSDGDHDDNEDNDDDNDSDSGNGSCGNGGNEDDEEDNDDDQDSDDDHSDGDHDDEEDNDDDQDSDDDDSDGDYDDDNDDDNDSDSGNGSCGNGGNEDENDEDSDDDSDGDGDDDDDDYDDDEDGNDSNSGSGNCGNGGNEDDNEEDDEDNDDDDGDDDENDSNSGSGNCGNGGNEDDNDEDEDDNDDDAEDNDEDGEDENDDNEGEDPTDTLAIQCPNDIELTCGSSVDPIFTGVPTALTTIATSYTDEYLSNACPLTIVRHWVITLSNGTGVFCDQNITVEDSEAPVITMTSDAITSCDDLNNLQYIVTDCDSNPNVIVQIVSSPAGIDCTIEGYRSQTQGGWGANPNGNNPATYLYTNFAIAFPNGLTIGCTNTLTLTSAQAITSFLPSGSTANALPSGSMIDPGNAYNNVLAGQLFAATLNVGFDSFDSSFGSSQTPFASLLVAQGNLQGTTVAELLSIANEVIGGCNNSYTFSEINEALSSLNENFDNGNTQNGYFICPAQANLGSAFNCQVEVIYTITATDHCGNTSSVSGSLSYIDNQAPSFVGNPTDIYIECGDSIPAIQVTDDCGNSSFEVTYSDVSFSGACLPTIERTYVAVDACGNAASFVQFIHLDDTQAPVISGIESNMTMACNNFVILPEPIVTDACGDPTVTYSENNNLNNCSGSLTRTWTATDACGNVSSFTQTITVLDNIAPTFISVPSNVSLPCGSAVPTDLATASDNCGNVNINVQNQTNNNSIGCQTITRIFTATDDCGNSSTAAQEIVFVDAIAPVFNNIPAAITMNCGSIIPSVNVTATDNCDNNVAVTMSEDYLIGDCETIITRTWVATDNCGNMQMADQTITLIDSTPPVFNMPAQLNVSCTGLTNLVANVSDSCSPEIIVTHQDVTTGQGCSYDIQRTYTAVDLCGNTSQFVQNIHVADTQAPVFSMVPSSYTTACTNPAAPIAPTAVDNCTSNVPVTMTETWSGSGCSQQVVRTWTATDACGNASSVSQTIVISDNQPPIIMGVPQSYTASCQNFQYPAVPATIVVTDNCAIQTSLQFQESTVPGGCDGSYTIIRTWTATDQCGNTAVANQSITVADTQAPVWSSTPASVQITCGSPMPAMPILSVTDNCTVDPIIDFFEFEESTDCGQLITRFWSATDACGNTSSRTQTITVTDAIAPVISPSAPSLLQVNCNAIPAPIAPAVSDNCSAVNLSMNEEINLDGCPYHIIRTWTAIDGCGNQSNWIQTIEVLDNQTPLFGAMPGDLEVSCDAVPNAIAPILTDCSDVTLQVDETSTIGSCPSNYDILRVYTATDGCGNVTTHSHTIHVIDNEAPMLINVPSDMTADCGELIAIADVMAIDNCQNQVVVIFEENTITPANAEETCQLTTPDAVFGDVALWLPGLNGIGANYTFTGTPTLVTQTAAASAVVQAEVVNTANPAHRWLVELHLVNGRNWSDWSALGRNYKDDLGIAANFHQDWMYYELAATSSAIGLGDLTGSSLQFSHAPITYYYGFQIGERANNRNTDYGMSGWMLYSGIVNGEIVNGHGDFFSSNDCCQSQTIERTWTATDCAGNAVSHIQTIQVGNHSAPLAPIQPQPILPQLEVSYAGSETFDVAFRTVKAGKTTIEMYNMQGQLITQIYSNVLEAGEEVRMNYPSPGLRNAIYFFKMISADQVVGAQSMMMR